jgi:hypothetical protein
MPKYWMINDRSQGGVGPDVNFDGVTYWVSDKQPLTDIKNWRQVTGTTFQKLLVGASDKFPAHDQRMRNKVTSRFSFMVITKRLQKPRGFIRTFARDFLMARIASASAFFTTGLRAAMSWGMSLTVRMRACALRI